MPRVVRPLVRLLSFPNKGLRLRKAHPKKEVEEALKEAEATGFDVEDKRGHWGVIHCPGAPPESCQPFWVWSTPKNAGNHAKQIRRYVARCPHRD
jgi:hypothetical protein